MRTILYMKQLQTTTTEKKPNNCNMIFKALFIQHLPQSFVYKIYNINQHH